MPESSALSRRAIVRGLAGTAVAAAAVVVPAVGAQAAPRADRSTAPARRPRTSTRPTGTSAATTTAATSAGSSSVSGTANLKALVADVRAHYPRITDVGTVRPDSLPDHPSGRAADFMMPNGVSDKALGDDLAEYVRANATRLNVSYIIWRQRIWSVARASQGWRAMANRGSATANHMDHVHVTVR